MLPLKRLSDPSRLTLGWKSFAFKHFEHEPVRFQREHGRVLNMGHEHSSKVIIGFTIEEDDLLRPFTVTKPEEYREEEWTGPQGQKRTERILVCKEHDVYVLEGVEHEDATELVEAIANLVKADISVHGNYVVGSMTYGIESRSRYEPTENDGIPLDHAIKVGPDLARIHSLFNALFGLELGEPAIHTLDSYG